MRRCFRKRELHGLTREKSRPPEYSAWHQMISRCTTPTHARFPDYGGRGIRVCERWMSFVSFISDMGHRPGPEYTIERVDNDGNYEPGNCRWVHRSEQARNRRNCCMITFQGRTQTRSAWAKEIGLAEATLKERLKLGWDIEKAFTMPVGAAVPNITRGRSLTRDQAAEVRARALAGESDSELAAVYGVSPKTVGKIRRGKIWVHADARIVVDGGKVTVV